MTPKTKEHERDETLNNGDEQYENGNVILAIAYYTKALELDPNHRQGYYTRGDFYYELNQYEQAIADYTKVIELDPNNSLAYCYRGYCYHKLKQDEQAILSFKKALELNPDNELYKSGYNRVLTALNAKNQTAKNANSLSKTKKGTSNSSRKVNLMSQDRNQDLQAKIKEAYQLLSLMESQHLTSSDPKERMRLKRDIDETKAQIASYQTEYNQIAPSQPTYPPTAPANPQTSQTSKLSLSPQEQSKLRRYLTEKFSLPELKGFASDMDIDYQTLPHSDKIEFARELIDYCKRKNLLLTLLQLALEQYNDPEIAQLLQKPA